MPSEANPALFRHGAIMTRDLGEGRGAWIYPMLHTFRIAVGAVEGGGYDDCWCYKDLLNAYTAFCDWNPATEPEPQGWVRHPPSGRRRFPDGDPATEEVRS
jgi:hypothetical protein